MRTLVKLIGAVAFVLSLANTTIASLPEDVAIDVAAVDTPSPEKPKTYLTYDKIPKGDYVLWQASSFGLSELKYRVPADHKFVEVLLIIRNRGKEPFTIYQDKIALKRDGQETKWWEAVPPGHPKDEICNQPSFEKESSLYRIYHLESKGGECTLKTGQQTFIILLFMVPKGWNEGTLVVTPDHGIKIKIPIKGKR